MVSVRLVRQFLYLYEMLTYLAYLIFILSVALAAGGIILASRLRTRYRSGPFNSLLYFEVFIYTFGFYGIWGRVLIKAFLSPVISKELLQRFTDISMLLGLPFLLFSWLMLILFSSVMFTDNLFLFLCVFLPSWY